MKLTRTVRTALTSLLLGAAAGLILLGCPVTSADDCAALGTCDDGSGGGATTTGTGGTTTTTGVPAECSELAEGDKVGEDCGVFVSPQGGSDDTGDGTQQAPYATLTKAIAAAPSTPIFVCAGDLEEALLVSGDVRLFGGFACDTWTYGSPKPTLTAAPDVVPVTVGAGAVFTAQDFAITAVAATTAGTSSIALFAQQDADVELTRVDLVAGDGAPGADGVKPMGVGPNGESQKGGPGMKGGDGCMQGVTPAPGQGGSNTCGTDLPAGGLGGLGTATSGGDGSSGEPVIEGSGKGGTGAKLNGDACLPGQPGKPGDPGADGPGATAPGTLSNDRFLPAAGDSGATGTPGQGGGGGGGGRGCDSMAGPSGGGGGAGGCGGAGGPGGGGGGASIGLAAYKAKRLVLTGVTIQTGKGGLGGRGADGQSGGGGGDPGLAGLGGDGACSGGAGGPGGTGGAGGGGRGGHSIGLLYSGTAPVIDNIMYSNGGAGAGGPGGLGNDQPNAGTGDGGVAENTLEL